MTAHTYQENFDEGAIDGGLEPRDFLDPYVGVVFPSRDALIDTLTAEMQPPEPQHAPRWLFAELVKFAATRDWLLENTSGCRVLPAGGA